MVKMLEKSELGRVFRNTKLLAMDVIPILVAGCLSGLVALSTSVSFASLIFSGDLTQFIPYGVNIVVATTVISGICISLLSGCRQIIAIPDDDTAPILALMVALVAASIPIAAQSTTLATVLATIALTALIAGLFLFCLGQFRLGGIIEYLPYPVIGGYFAGAGWLLISGALKVTTGLSITSVSGVLSLVEPINLLKCFIALLIALAAFFYVKSKAHPVGLVAIFGISVVMFYVIGSLFGLSITEFMAKGWLLGPFSSVSPKIWNTMSLSDFKSVEWRSIFTNLDSFGTILMMSAISIMLTVSGLSLLFRQDLNVNRELKVSGLANILCGLSGGMLSLPSIGVSSMVASIGAPHTRLIGIVSALFCGLILFTCIDLVAYIPLPVLAGILMYMGINFFKEWLIDAYQKFNVFEYLVIVAILFVVATVGFIEGVSFGLIAAIVLFVINYSQTEFVRYELSCVDQKSTVERNLSQQKILRDQGTRVLILGLQGYLFFGTASKIYKLFRERVDNRTQMRIEYFLLDFSKVTGIDSSAALVFIKMSQFSASQGIYLVVTGLNETVEFKLRKGGFGHQDTEFLLFLHDVDHGIEWCEEQLIAKTQPATVKGRDSLIDQIAAFLPGPKDLDVFLSYLVRRDISAGHQLTRQGDLSNELLFIESSSASVFIETPDGAKHRVRRSGPGTVFGELGFYLGVPRTATVIADQEGTIYCLPHRKLEEMEVAHPDLAAGFHRFMARMVTERLLFTAQTLEAVLR